MGRVALAALVAAVFLAAASAAFAGVVVPVKRSVVLRAAPTHVPLGTRVTIRA